MWSPTTSIAHSRARKAWSSSLFVLSLMGAAHAQTLGPEFAGDFTIDIFSSVPGVPLPYGGMSFKAGDSGKLLIVGAAETAQANIYEVSVTRDMLGHVTGFSGTAAIFASAPNAGAGLLYGPGDVLFYTGYPTNTLGQIEPGSTTADKVIDLSALGVVPSVGGIAITPAGFPDAGSLKITSFDLDFWYSANLVPDGMGTYDVTNLEFRTFLNGTGPQSIEYVDVDYPAFDVQSALVMEIGDLFVGAYEIDQNGDPIVSTRRLFFTCCNFCPSGSTTDQGTGDFLIAEAGCGNQIVVVKAIYPCVIQNYCVGGINSTGSSASIATLNSVSVFANDIDLFCSGGAPAGVNGLFFYGVNQHMSVFGDGFRCVSGALFRLPIVQTSGFGDAIYSLDLTNPPQPAGLITLGSTWNFQFWYRDPTGPGATGFNLSDGLQIRFCE